MFVICQKACRAVEHRKTACAEIWTLSQVTTESAEGSNSDGVSQVTGGAELNRLVQYSLLSLIQLKLMNSFN